MSDLSDTWDRPTGGRFSGRRKKMALPLVITYGMKAKCAMYNNPKAVLSTVVPERDKALLPPVGSSGPDMR
jgi:hypothetical protein